MGNQKKYSIFDIKKLLKININQPNITVINQITPQSEWKMFVPSEVDQLIVCS